MVQDPRPRRLASRIAAIAIPLLLVGCAGGAASPSAPAAGTVTPASQAPASQVPASDTPASVAPSADPYAVLEGKTINMSFPSAPDFGNVTNPLLEEAFAEHGATYVPTNHNEQDQAINALIAG